jgi:hypothetical protein
LAILLRLYVLPQAWLTLEDFVLLRLYVLPQAWVTLDDFVLFRLYVLPPEDIKSNQNSQSFTSSPMLEGGHKV